MEITNDSSGGWCPRLQRERALRRAREQVYRVTIQQEQRSQEQTQEQKQSHAIYSQPSSKLIQK